MDIGEVYCSADGFSKALIANDDESLANYLPPELMTAFRHPSGKFRLYGGRSYLQAQLLSVVSLGDEFDPRSAEAFASLTCFSGLFEEIVVRAVWAEDSNRLLIRALQMFDRKRSSDYEVHAIAS